MLTFGAHVWADKHSSLHFCLSFLVLEKINERHHFLCIPCFALATLPCTALQRAVKSKARQACCTLLKELWSLSWGGGGGGRLSEQSLSTCLKVLADRSGEAVMCPERLMLPSSGIVFTLLKRRVRLKGVMWCWQLPKWIFSATR